jgi:hypothetical protein
MEGGIVVIPEDDDSRFFSETNIEEDHENWNNNNNRKTEEEIPLGKLSKSKHRRSSSNRFEIPSMPTTTTAEVIIIPTDLETGVIISPRTI